MTPAWAQRQAELLSDCLVSPDVFQHMVDRLRDFVVPYQLLQESLCNPLFPNACQVLDYYHCSEYLHKVAKAQYGQTFQALEWVEATLTRLYMGQVGTVLGGLRRRQPTSAEALKAIDHCWVSLNDHRGRTDYGTFRRGGSPLFLG